MSKVKILSGLVALMALGLTACGGGNESSSVNKKSSAPAASSSKQQEVSSSLNAASQQSSANGAASSASGGETIDWLIPVQRNYVDGTPANNSSSKEYIPLNDATAGKVGVKISIQNFTLDADGTTATGLDSSGKINPGNDHDAYLRYRIVAPKAGAYQMIMRGKSSSNATEKTLNERAFHVKLNGSEVETEGDRAPLTASDTDFVACPTINLTGAEDIIDITASDYRIQFDVAGFITFAEH